MSCASQLKISFNLYLQCFQTVLCYWKGENTLKNHLKLLLKNAVIEEDSEDTVRLNAISLGEVAGLMYCAAKVNTQSYRDQSEKPPSALKHRTADMPALADTGCQAVCMGPEQLHSVGLSVGDLMPVDLRLSGANGSSIRIMGGLFISITGVDTRGKKWSTKQLCYVAEGVTRLFEHLSSSSLYLL